MTDSDIDRARRAALAVFLELRVREGYLVETSSDMHAVIAPCKWLSVKQTINPFQKATGRQVISVDDQAAVKMSPAERVRF